MALPSRSHQAAVTAAPARLAVRLCGQPAQVQALFAPPHWHPGPPVRWPTTVDQDALDAQTAGRGRELHRPQDEESDPTRSGTEPDRRPARCRSPASATTLPWG